MTGQIKFLNLYGDITIEWDDQDQNKMKQFIEEKLKEGYQFFIVEKKFCGLYSKKTKLVSTTDLKNKILIKDKDVETIFKEMASMKVLNDQSTSHKVIKNSNDVNEISKSSTVCTKPPQRG